MVKYVRSELKDDYGILELQDKILEIMVYIDSFCKDHKIDYCLMAGSALGARRHNGFIPWDDDIDIYMTEKDYTKFRKKFMECGNKSLYYLQEWGSVDIRNERMITFAKIRMRGTEIKEKNFVDWKMHHGIFVDIFILHRSSDNLLKQKIQYLWTEAVVLKGLSVRGYDAKNMKDSILLTIGKLMPKKWILKHGLMNAYKYQNEKTRYFNGFIDTRRFSNAIFSKEIIFPTKYAKFENVMLKVPANIDEYLKIQYGSNYMVIPDKNHRKVGKHAISWSIYNSERKDDFSDEYKLI